MKLVNSILFLIILQLPSLAQDSTNFNHKKFGFGAAFDDYSFYLPIFLGENLKIEPQIKFDLYSSSHFNHETKTFEIGAGIFYCLNYNRITPYFGIRAGYRYYNSSSEPDDFRKETGFFLSPTIGGEYFLLDRFSLGIELLTRYSHNKGTYKNYNGVEDINNYGFRTYTYFIMRVYLF